jgi:hypothetical protein
MKYHTLFTKIPFRILRYTNKHLPIFSLVFPWAAVLCVEFATGQPFAFYVNMYFTPSKYNTVSILLA